MKKFVLVLVVLCFVVGLGTTASAESLLLTLDEALARVEFHSDYQAWLANLENVEDTIQSVIDKHSLGLDLTSNLLRYTHNFDSETSQLSTGGSLSLSKSSLKGTTLTGSISPSVKLDELDLSTTWSIALEQTLWPSPSLSGDRITLTTAEQNQAVLQAQREYLVENTKLKIEDLYRTAQLAQARLALARTSLDNAQANLVVIVQKAELGEASEADLISGQLSVLRSERELESSLMAAQTALDNLLTALDLTGDYRLAPLEVSNPPAGEGDLDVAGLLGNLENHPLVLPYRSELEKARLELQAANSESKPAANLTLRLEDSPTNQTGGGLRFQATVSIGYPLLDRNQRVRTLEERIDAVENAEESHQTALHNIQTALEDGVSELSKLARDREIARLSVRQAQLEMEAAQTQFDLGIIDQSILTSAEMGLLQAELDYWEASHRYDLAKRRLSQGIVGDLSGGMPR
ncbi:MAG: TolC family protein [Firmicutes bacterium]|nr:TolC family protein [Bacillota bacterium]